MRLAVIAVLANAVAPLGHAQTVCEDVARINTSGIHRFESIKGAFATDEAYDELYESKATLFGAHDCLIDQRFEPRHACAWELETEAELIAAYAEKAGALAPCLAGWERNGLLVSDPSEPYRVLAGMGYLGAGEYAVIVWEIIADFDGERDARSRYRLSITAIDYS